MIISQVSYRTNGPLVVSIPMLRLVVVVFVVVVHNFQTSSPLKPLCQSKPNFYGTSLGRGNQSLYKWPRSHDQYMPLYGKNLKNSLLMNQWTDFNEIWYVTRGLCTIIVYINRDLGLALTFFFSSLLIFYNLDKIYIFGISKTTRTIHLQTRNSALRGMYTPG